MNSTTHLSEDQIIQAVVDGPDTAAEIRLHLESCADCRARVLALETDLGGMAHMASQGIEAPPRPASFAAAAQPASRRGLWATAIAGGLAAAAALVLALMPAAQLPHSNDRPVVQVAVVDEQITLEDDLYWQPEDSFSTFDQYIMAADEPALDEEFLEFVAPDIDQTTSLIEIGRSQC